MTIACKQIILFCLLLCCGVMANAQTDTTYQRMKMDTIRLSEDQTREMQNAYSNPGWYVLKQIGSFFNVGVYYSYLMPAGSFSKQVKPASAFTFDFGLDLTRMFGQNESNLHLIIGLNADYANFGKMKNPYALTNGDTTYEVTLKNSMETYSYFVEAEYRKSFLCPFVSVAFSEVFINPYKEVKTIIQNATTNYSSTEGERLGNRESTGFNLSAGLKCKYRFNDHAELMVLSKISYLRSSAIDMVDLSGAGFSPTGDITYQTNTVNPSWLMYSIGVKYNF